MRLYSKRAEGEVKQLFLTALVVIVGLVFAWWKWGVSSPVDLKVEGKKGTTYTVVGVVDKVAEGKGDYDWYRVSCKSGSVWIKTFGVVPSVGSGLLVCGVLEGKLNRGKKVKEKWRKYWLVENFRMPLFAFFASAISK